MPRNGNKDVFGRARGVVGTGKEYIYCVVAATVQPTKAGTSVYPDRTNVASSVVQPAGRLIAQAAHVVSLARLEMARWVIQYDRGNLPIGVEVRSDGLWRTLKEPVTTIVLGARDSFELYHVLHLLRKAKIQTHGFYDCQQKDYGSLETTVLTAVATEPVKPDKVKGILDYLPLWKP